MVFVTTEKFQLPSVITSHSNAELLQYTPNELG